MPRHRAHLNAAGAIKYSPRALIKMWSPREWENELVTSVHLPCQSPRPRNTILVGWVPLCHTYSLPAIMFASERIKLRCMNWYSLGSLKRVCRGQDLLCMSRLKGSWPGLTQDDLAYCQRR
jgi:hypothetical protein